MDKFLIRKNEFLTKDIPGFFHQYYTGYLNRNNPNFINTLKNTFNSYKYDGLVSARDTVREILISDIPRIMKSISLEKCVCVCVPRAKSESYYTEKQLMFKEAVSMAVSNLSCVIDGTDCIRRVVNTRTTHLLRPTSIINDGAMPYPGITTATCKIDIKGVNCQSIILVDDIYTKNINIDEDCIQALLKNGAKDVIFYAIGYTRRD